MACPGFRPASDRTGHDRRFHDPRGLGGGEAVLGLALEFGFANEHREHHRGADHHIVGRDGGGALAVAGALGISFSPLVSALRRPGSWVPPSGVGTVLQ